MKNLLRSLIVVLIFTAGIISNLHADVNVVINLKRPLPPSLSDWRNDPTLIQLTLTANQNYPQIRIAFTITNTDNNQEIAKTRDNSPAMPRFNLYANTPLMVTGPQIVREDALDLNSSIRETATTTQMLPEGNYEFCVRILDQNGAQITQTGASCRNSFITIPDPPQLISPLDITLPGAIPVLPQFLWAPVANPPRGVLISYLLKIAPLFQGQDIRTAIDNNPLLFNKLLQAGRTSYQYLPSDLPFSRYPDANGYVWQVQALDNQNKPITRNDGKSEIGKFFIGSDIPADFSGRYVKHKWSRNKIHMEICRFRLFI